MNALQLAAGGGRARPEQEHRHDRESQSWEPPHRVNSVYRGDPRLFSYWPHSPGVR
jgi:hypothetical protein